MLTSYNGFQVKSILFSTSRIIDDLIVNEESGMAPYQRCYCTFNPVPRCRICGSTKIYKWKYHTKQHCEDCYNKFIR